MNVHRVIRIVALGIFAVALGLATHRLHRTPEQKALVRFVEADLPKLVASEGPIHERIDRLGRAPGLKPEEARALLVDDVIPRLLRLRKQTEEVPVPSDETRALLTEYQQVTDALLDACRTCVRVIDDPKLPTEKGLAEVRDRFNQVRQAYKTWERHLQEACARHRLASPPQRS